MFARFHSRKWAFLFSRASKLQWLSWTNSDVKSSTCVFRSRTAAIFDAFTAVPRIRKITLAEHELLDWDEYERLVRILVGIGIRKVRVTGGEPLVRPGVEDFVARLKALAVQDLSMTTNGFLLAERCDRLVAAGLDRINISLDSLDAKKFEQITRTKTFNEVICRNRSGAGFAPASGKSECSAGPWAERQRDWKLSRNSRARRISSCGSLSSCRWMRTAPGLATWWYPPRKFIGGFRLRWPLIPVVHERSETARKYRFADGRGEIGLIAPVTQPFCGHCSRIRLTADGKLRTCLFSKEDHDLKGRASQRCDRPRSRRCDCRDRRPKGKEPPHQRARLCSTFAHHGLYWWLILRRRDSLDDGAK